MRHVKRCPVCNREAPAAKKFCPFDGSPLEEVVVDGPAPPRPRLLVETGDGGSIEVPLGDAALTIGKGSDNELVLTDPSVSRNHATILKEGGVYRIVDNGSRNGVIVNGVKMADATRVLQNGDVVVLGRTQIRFVDQAQAAAVSTASPETAAPEPATYGFLDVFQGDTPPLRLPLRSREVTIGRATDADVVLVDNTVSRQQALMRFADGKWRIENKGRNAISVNGAVVPPEGRTLVHGDAIAIGSARMTLSLSGASLAGLTTSPTEQPLVPPASSALPPTSQAPKPPIVQPPSMQAPTQAPPPQFRVRATGELFPIPGVTSPAEPQQPQQPGTERLVIDGKYEIEAKLAEVSTGTVYRARRIVLGDRVALRVLRPDLVQDQMAVERFRRQAQVAARMRHPNVVQVYDFGVSTEGAVFIVEELLSGRTLRDVVREQRGLTLNRIVGIMNQVCGAVHAAHVNGIVLRDVRPDSIFVDQGPDGREVVKVGGFGLAKIVAGPSGGVTMAAAAKVYGRPEYMSPEQWLDRQLDSRADVYSLGIILFELITGVVPFSAPQPMQIAQLHLTAPVPNLADYGRYDVDEAVGTIVSRALAKEPRLRQPTALHLAAEFEAVAGASGGIVQNLFKKTGLLQMPQAVVVASPVPVAPGEAVLPSVVAEAKSKGRGAMNSVVVALMAEAFLSRLSSGLVKTSVPLYALLVFGLPVTKVMILVLIQNVVPLLLKTVFGSLADTYGKKAVFMVSLTIRTIVGALYAVAFAEWIFYLISLVRGVADSAKGPSVSALIADSTDERHIAKAFAYYSTVKSTSGGIGEALAAFMLVALLGLYAGGSTATANVAVLEETNAKGEAIELVVGPDEVGPDQTIAPEKEGAEPRRVARVEPREVALKDVAIEDLPKVVSTGPLKTALVAIFVAATALSLLSLLLVAVVVKEEKKKKGEKKAKSVDAAASLTGETDEKKPNVWAYALLGTALTAPSYMVSGEFFTVLATDLAVTATALGWIKLFAETLVPLVMGPVFGWLADKIGAGKVIALRSVANAVTSVMFWVTPWFAGTALLGLMLGTARGIDEMGKAAFKPTWGAIAAKVSSFDLSRRTRTMGILEGGTDASELAFPVLAGVLLDYVPLGWLMGLRAFLAVVAEVYAIVLHRMYKL